MSSGAGSESSSVLEKNSSFSPGSEQSPVFPSTFHARNEFSHLTIAPPKNHQNQSLSVSPSTANSSYQASNSFQNFLQGVEVQYYNIDSEADYYSQRSKHLGKQERNVSSQKTRFHALKVEEGDVEEYKEDDGGKVDAAPSKEEDTAGPQRKKPLEKGSFHSSGESDSDQTSSSGIASIERRRGLHQQSSELYYCKAASIFKKSLFHATAFFFATFLILVLGNIGNLSLLNLS